MQEGGFLSARICVCVFPGCRVNGSRGFVVGCKLCIGCFQIGIGTEGALMLNCERTALWQKPLSVQLVGVSMALELLIGLSSCIVP